MMSEHRVSQQRILLVAENVSAQFGGEAFLPLHYFRVLRARDVEVFLLTHARVRAELYELFPNDKERMFFIEDTPLQVGLWRAGQKLPRAMNEMSLGAMRQTVLQRALRQRARELVKRLQITVVHQAAPVSPRKPSGIFAVGAPVVIGPLNGNMSLPSGFADFMGGAHRLATNVGRPIAEAANRLSPGKVQAAVLLVANPRTREGLPECVHKVPVIELVENGVDMSRFAVKQGDEVKGLRGDGRHGPRVEFVFLGRLVDWKAVNLLLDALALLPTDLNFRLRVIGDGDQRLELESQTHRLGLSEKIEFTGFLPQQEVASLLDEMDLLILPSLYECGGAVVLEAMAKSIAVIASNWGGPADYLDETCGLLVEPRAVEQFVEELSSAILELCTDPERRQAMGRAGRAKVERVYDWERKVDRVLEIYDDVAPLSGRVAAE